VVIRGSVRGITDINFDFKFKTVNIYNLQRNYIKRIFEWCNKITKELQIWVLCFGSISNTRTPVLLSLSPCWSYHRGYRQQTDSKTKYHFIYPPSVGLHCWSMDSSGLVLAFGTTSWTFFWSSPQCCFHTNSLKPSPFVYCSQYLQISSSFVSTSYQALLAQVSSLQAWSCPLSACPLSACSYWKI